jgi:GH15 family glucan-1,4-alpha-glucosidase
MTRTSVERHGVVIARDLMERLLQIGSPLGLFAEEFDPQTYRHLGNFPQAFSLLR